ncbi:MAG TPA: UDP-N-acetylmuramoyl-L-alanine--D-glutamate ligase [Candidatus Paceibacterota bacterium]
MNGYKELFEGKRITIIGLGLLGRGVGDAEFLAKCGAEVLVTDKKTEEQLANPIERLKKYKNISFRLGGHEEKDFINCDLVVKAAKVPINSSFIIAARKAGVPVVMSTALFAQKAIEIGVTTVGITGTRGKSTVTHMINHALKLSGKSAHLGGNVRGISTLALLPEIDEGDIAVLELDSWQLQGFGDLKISPHVAVFTNFMPDHLDYYPSMDEYFRDKANIFRYQHDGDSLFVGSSISERVAAARPPIPPSVPSPIPGDWSLKIPGEHNRENASFASATLRALGQSEPEIRRGLESFDGLEGRLQFLGARNGVKIYNDNSSTTPEATITALRAVGNPRNKNIVLIMGGDDKKLDMSPLVAEIPKWCSSVVLFKERGTDRIREDIFALTKNGISVYEEEGLSSTVNRALSVAKKGDTILYSPAFTSFGKYFANEYDRSDQFVAAIRAKGLV